MNPETDTSSPPPPVRNRRAPRYLWFRLSSLLCVVILLSSFAWTHWKGEQILEETRDLARYDAFTERWCGALLAVIAAVVVLFLFWKRQWNRDLRAGLVVRKSAWAEFKRHWPLQILLGLLAVLPWYAVQQWTERIKNPLFRLPWQTEQTWVDSGRILRLVRNNGLTVTVIGNRPAARDIDRLFPEDDASARPDPPQFDVYPHESFVYRSPVSRHWAVEAIFRPSFGDHFPDWFGLAVDHLDAESFVDRVRGGCMQSGGGPTLVSPEYDGSPRSDEIGPWFAFAWVPARLETIPVYCLYADPSEAEDGVLARFRADPASIATNPPAGTRPFVLWMHQTTERAPAAYRRPLFENFPAARNPAVSEPHAESAAAAASEPHAESAEGAEDESHAESAEDAEP